ncbi:hypothetical protein Achl_0130 [Pseudarthrobacter chlorophenolicus A6]|uniref:Uncharacterized protein n=1 Tax=Pseudarthrobacter chlorophenolicus (strain ATCC 700700 / DSM 12829 / CIP 107037 / JCM 12360 / KCTC 9906 / NCIMB 13794 / A6) TaxID=452863 RepID=B8H8F9_PSECP|nr:hypothetical protein Achl_0130 [Pseudarthrobacter chlorophenolicus A6]SDQ54707.1 hypothetical protein SAMN04489738_1403 [Pseudarthrobacter chlorophenolicus]
MITETTSLGATRNSNLILGSGLSGMVAAYIDACALEDEASQHEDWSAERALRLRLPRWRPRNIRPGGTGPALAS